MSLTRCSSTNTMQWEPRINVRGRSPARRYGHSMVALNPPSTSSCSYAKLAVFGGTSGTVCHLLGMYATQPCAILSMFCLIMFVFRVMSR